MARSIAALVKGYAEFDRDLNLKGLLLNKVGSAAHGTWLKEALAAAAATQQQQQQQSGGLGLAGVQVLGCVPKVSLCCCCSCCCCFFCMSPGHIPHL
jgi:cobyrinic acid a,c-diamide synthase